MITYDYIIYVPAIFHQGFHAMPQRLYVSKSQTFSREPRKQNPSYFPLYWLFHRDPYHGLSYPHITGWYNLPNIPKQPAVFSWLTVFLFGHFQGATSGSKLPLTLPVVGANLEDQHGTARPGAFEFDESQVLFRKIHQKFFLVKYCWRFRNPKQPPGICTTL